MKKLLIVDNSNLVPNILSDFFSKTNEFKIFIAKSFAEAKVLVQAHTFFASISSIVLPDALNGEMLDLLSEKNIPTVVLSSSIDSELIEKMSKVNVTDYISKDSIHELKSTYRLIKLLKFTENLEILIVDDSEVITSKLKAKLETLLLKVFIAKSGNEALNILNKNPKIKMIITDYNMDDMDGLELTKKVRKTSNHCDIPIIIMTSENNNGLKARFYKNGATDFLVKPVLDEELKAKVIDIFSRKKQIKEIKLFNKVIDENIITSSTNTQGVILEVSKAFSKISGYKQSELIGKKHSLIRHPDMPKSLFDELWNTVESGKKWKGEIKNLRKDGSYYWVKEIVEPTFDKNGTIIGYTFLRQDITDKKRIYELSITDGLTSLFNRRYFNEMAQNHIKDTIRNNNTFGFLILDVDNFKKYNDTYGHHKGDEVLISVASSLKNTFKRSDDKIFRLGGEEFGVLISSKNKDDVLKLTEEARKDIEFLNIEHEKNKPLKVITASFGLVILSSNTKELNLDDIYKIGDEKLYEAKANGRNRIEFIKL